jgi:AcrR family transcriptional regulator
MAKEDRRAAILDAARGAFLEKGYEATRISDIVRGAGIAQGTFYLHFPSKTDVFLALTDTVTRAIHESTLEAATGAQSLSEAIELGTAAAFASAAEHRDVLALILTSPLLIEVRAQTARIAQALHRGVAALVEQALASGESKARVDAKVVAHLVFGVVDMAVHMSLVHGVAKPDVCLAETQAFLRRALGIA